MANIDDGGIVKADVLALLNPELSVDRIQIGAAANGTGGVGASLSYTVAGQTWDIDQWADYYLLVGSTWALITANTATVLTVAENLTGASGTWQIRVQHPTMTDAQFVTLTGHIWARVKSSLPEKYRKMLYRVDGEILVADATDLQTTATLSIVSTAADLFLYKNYNAQIYHQRRIAQALDVTTDYTFAQSTSIVTFVSALVEGDVVFADYSHSLPTIPSDLKRLGVDLLAATIEREAHGRPSTQESGRLVGRLETVERELTALRKGEIGIDYFDKIKLVDETRESEAIAGGVFSGRVIRG